MKMNQKIDIDPIGHKLRKSEKSQENCKIVWNLGLTSNWVIQFLYE